MIIQIIRKIFFLTLKLIAVLTLILLLIGLWIYTGPRNVPYLASYITKEISTILPPGNTFALESVVIGFDDDKSVVLKLLNAKLHNEAKGDIELKELKARINLLGLLPQSNHNLLNIQISQPKVQMNKLLSSGEDTQDGPLPIEKINSYIEKYKDNLLKFSLLLTNTELNFEMNNEESFDVKVNSLILSPQVQHHELVFVLYGDVNIRDKNSIVDVTFDTNSNQFLEAKGTISNISTSLMDEVGFPIDELKGSHVEADLSFFTQVSSLKKVDRLDFEVSNFEGKINKNHFFPVDITPSFVNLKGECIANCKEINIHNFEIKADYLDLNSSFVIQRLENKSLLNGTFQIEKIPVNHVKDYWPTPVTGRTREWIFEHISGGTLTKASGKMNLNLTEIATKKKINKNDVSLHLRLDDTSVSYMDGVPPVTNVNADVIINGDEVAFKISAGKIKNSKIIAAEGLIPDLANSKSRVEVKADVTGTLQDLVDLAYAHAEIPNDKYKNLGGKTVTKVNVTVPIQDEDLKLKDITLNVSSKITEAKAENIYKDFDLRDGTLSATYKDHKALITGAGKIGDKFLADIKADIDFIKDAKNISVKTKLNWDDVEKLGYTKPEYFNHSFTAAVVILEENNVSKEFIDLDLTNSTVYARKFGIKKKIGEPGLVRFSMNESKDVVEIPTYEVTLGDFYSAGSGILSKDMKDIISLNSHTTKLGKGDFKFNYKKSANKDIVNIEGESLDISQISFTERGDEATKPKGEQSKGELVLNTNLHKIHMKNFISLSKPHLEVICSEKRCEKVKLSGDFDGGGHMNLDISYPKIELNSNNAGKVIKAFGISDKIENGVLQCSGSFTGETFNGQISMNNFVVHNAPVLAKILSLASLTLTSFEGISSLVGTSGVKFDKFTCLVQYNNGLISLKDCGAKGNTMAIAAEGKIDLKADNININGIVIPENIVNKLLKNIPVIKDVFGDKPQNEAIGVNFSVTGSTDDPEVKSNPLSLLTPGFLRNIFGGMK